MHKRDDFLRDVVKNLGSTVYDEVHQTPFIHCSNEYYNTMKEAGFEFTKIIVITYYCYCYYSPKIR